MRFSRSVSLFPFQTSLSTTSIYSLIVLSVSARLSCIAQSGQKRQDDALILSHRTMRPHRKKTKQTQSWKPLQKYFTYQQVHNDTANKPDYLFTNYRQLCLFTNYSTAGFKATHHRGVTLVVEDVLAAGVVVALLPSQSRGLIRALVGGLIAIGRDPTGLRAVPCRTLL